MESESSKQTSEFESSPLGTKEYWDNLYQTELKNFNEFGDEGTIWFGRISETTILRFINAEVDRAVRILDIGCGNGSLLRKLHKNGFTNLAGVDYSENAIEFAKRSSETDQIDYRVVDLTAVETDPQIKAKFDVVTDKGTWDAISLNAQNMLEAYRRTVENLFDPSVDRRAQYFIIISCNFTSDELKDMFSTEHLKFHEKLSAQHSFTFGGKVGQTTSGAVFKFIR